MKKNNIPFEQIYDLFAVRIIVDCPPAQEKSVCWQVYSIVTDNYRPNPSRLRDWISNTKTNGYESLHTTVMSNTGKWVEVQIRSERMDDIAEKGYAAHWKYKEDPAAKDKTDYSGKSSPAVKNHSALDEWIEKVRDLLQYENTNALEFINDFKSNLYNKEIFVFTPKGDLKIMPNGSTALDFAFEVHTDIGLHCKAAKINHKLVPLSYKLKNGDQVEVVAHPSQHPSNDWKKIARTTKAKRILKEYFNGAEKAIEAHGKEVFQKFLKKHKVKSESFFLQSALTRFGYETSKKFFNDIGRKKFLVSKLKSIIIGEVPQENKKSLTTPSGVVDKEKIKQINKSELIIGTNGVSDLKYSFANCCKPIAGEDIFGFVTISDGIKIHKTSCENAPELMASYGYRIIKAKWENSVKETYLTKIKVRGTDRNGLMSDLTASIAKYPDINIKRLRAETFQDIVEDEFHLEIKNVSILKTLFEDLILIEGVISVERLED